MRVRRAALFLAAATAVPLFAAAVPASASPPHHGLALMFIVDQVSFEQLMAVPEFKGLARTGGAGLMTTKVGTGDRQRASYLTIGAGSVQSGDGRSSLLATRLQAQGVSVCIDGGADLGTRSPSDPIRLLGTDSAGLVGCDLGPAATSPPMVPSGDALLIVGLQLFPPCPPDSPCGFQSPNPDLAGAGAVLRSTIESLAQQRVLVMVVTPRPSSEMDAVGDEVTPLLMAQGSPGELLSASGPMHGLTSDTTRQDGLVANVDVAPTVLRFFGLAVPSQMDGQPIGPDDGGAPSALHRLHLEQRRIRVPIQAGELAFICVAGVIGIAALVVLAIRGSLPPRMAEALRFMALSVVALAIPLLAGGLLPRLTYAVVVPFILLSVLVLTVFSLVARWNGALGPFMFLGAVGLAVLALDATLGSRASRLPLIGGTMFDGVRFYGLPNAFIALLLGSALFLAAALEPLPGFVVLAAAGLFAGFPGLGADFGGSIMLFFAAGLWWVLRTRPKTRLRQVATVVGVTAGGALIVLAVNRFLPGVPTHVTRFVERTGSSPGSALDRLHHRLAASFGQLWHGPPSLIPIVGLVVVLWLVLAQPGPIRRSLAPYPAWRDMLVVLTAASLVGFLANDTGVSAAAPGFLYAMPALVYPAFLWASRAKERMRR